MLIKVTQTIRGRIVCPRDVCLSSNVKLRLTVLSLFIIIANCTNCKSNLIVYLKIFPEIRAFIKANADSTTPTYFAHQIALDYAQCIEWLIKIVSFFQTHVHLFSFALESFFPQGLADIWCREHASKESVKNKWTSSSMLRYVALN